MFEIGSNSIFLTKYTKEAFSDKVAEIEYESCERVGMRMNKSNVELIYLSINIII